MADATIKVMDKGPLYVSGSVQVVDATGETIHTKEAFALCRCGESHNKPFCDGAHAAAGFDHCVRAADMANR